jgi:hypothetical protein
MRDKAYKKLEQTWSRFTTIYSQWRDKGSAGKIRIDNARMGNDSLDKDRIFLARIDKARVNTNRRDKSYGTKDKTFKLVSTVVR